MKKEIKVIKKETYHGTNQYIMDFRLHGLNYTAIYNYKTKECSYGRELPCQYYDTIDTIEGGIN